MKPEKTSLERVIIESVYGKTATLPENLFPVCVQTPASSPLNLNTLVVLFFPLSSVDAAHGLFLYWLNWVRQLD